MSEFQQIRYDVGDHIATIELHRPEAMNAFTGRMLHELIAAFDLADGDDDVGAVIVGPTWQPAATRSRAAAATSSPTPACPATAAGWPPCGSTPAVSL
jgi:1,4-dihydroxy-2-naphthoyl-CoA synthase